MQPTFSINDTKLGIIGNGNYGKALATRCKIAGQPYMVGSRRAGNSSMHTTTYEKVCKECEIIILCIPRHAYESVVDNLKGHLTNQIVVDISNVDSFSSTSNALYLQSMLPNSNVMKALNTVSAYSLESDSYGATRDTYVCGDCKQSRDKLIQVLREIGLNPIDRGRLNSAVGIEHMPHRFFEGWGTACIITGVVLAFCIFWTYLRFFWVSKSKAYQSLGLYWANRMVGWVTLWNLSLVYLPGVLAGYIQLAWGTKYRPFPNWLDRWMKCRKELGLITLTLASMHMCLSAFAMGAHIVKYMLVSTVIPGTGGLKLWHGLKWNAEVSIIFATISLALMTIVGVTSLPSVGSTMSWKEWNFVQSGIGFSSLLFGFSHVMIYMYNVWDPKYKWTMVPGVLLMPIMPLVVIALKAVLWTPGLVCYLDRIRDGRVNRWKRESEDRRILMA